MLFMSKHLQKQKRYYVLVQGHTRFQKFQKKKVIFINEIKWNKHDFLANLK